MTAGDAHRLAGGDLAGRTTVPRAVVTIAAQVEDRLCRLLDEQETRWAAVHPSLEAPMSLLRSYVLAGGKRLRPAFCYWAFVGSGGDPSDERIIDAGAALEMLHTAALVHDDIIDRSDRRHGSDTIHVSFAGRHRQAGWRGDPASFGEAAAIIVGDLALVHSSQLMAGASEEAMAVFEEMRLEVNVGQYLDLVAAATPLTGSADEVEAARLVCRYKTAKYTVERPMHLGASLAAGGATDNDPALISAFAIPLGEAFQLRDDLLGAFGDPEVTGKPVGDDLAEGKATVLAALAAGRGSDSERAGFAQRFGDRSASPVDLAAMAHHLERSGARAEVEGLIQALTDQAAVALDALPFSREALDALADLAAFVTGRDR